MVIIAEGLSTKIEIHATYIIIIIHSEIEVSRVDYQPAEQ